MPKLKLTATSGNGYSVYVTHFGVKGTVIRNRPYPFAFRPQAAGYVGDMHAFYTALGYAPQTADQPNVWEYAVAGEDTILLEVDAHVAARIRLELVENAPGYVPPPVDEDNDETLELSEDERAELDRELAEERTRRAALPMQSAPAGWGFLDLGF